MLLRIGLFISETNRSTRYVLCSYVLYTHAHARPSGARFARQQTQPNARARPLVAATTQRLPSTGTDGAHSIGLARPSVDPSAAAARVPPLMAQKMRQHIGHGALELKSG